MALEFLGQTQPNCPRGTLEYLACLGRQRLREDPYGIGMGTAGSLW
jgi:hypothetical protein